MNQTRSRFLRAAQSAPVRLSLALLLLALAVVRLVPNYGLGDRIDLVTLAFLASAAVVVFVPLENATTVKVAGVELVLASPQVRGALQGALDRVSNLALQNWLWDHPDQVEAVPGSRVLWIDDYPNEVLGERRILRALGVEVVAASSTEAAVAVLREDADFDLLISDIQRLGGTSYLQTGFRRGAEGTNFVIRLRNGQVPELSDVPIARKLPVIIYAAFPPDGLVEFTAPLKALKPEPDVTNEAAALVRTAVLRLAEARAAPIEAPAKKVPT